MNAMHPMQQEMPEAEVLREKIRTFAESMVRATAQLLIDCGGGRGPDTKVFKEAQQQPKQVPQAEPAAPAAEASTPQDAAPSTTEAYFKPEHHQTGTRRSNMARCYSVKEFYAELVSIMQPEPGARYSQKALQGAMLRACARRDWQPLTAKAVRYACYMHGCKKHVVERAEGKATTYMIFPGERK